MYEYTSFRYHIHLFNKITKNYYAGLQFYELRGMNKYMVPK